MARAHRAAGILVMLAVLAALLASSCSGGGGEGRLTVYSGRTEELIGPLLQQFSERTGTPIDVRYGDSAELALLIVTEGSKSPADVFISQSPGALGYLEGLEMLAALDASTTGLVSPSDRSPDGTWVGLSGRQRVLVYNTEMVDESELPESVLDLTDPAYAGRVAVAPANASFQDFVSAMRAVIGDDAARTWLEGMAANDSPTYANNTAIVEAVGRGEVPMGLVNHYYNVRALAEDPDQPTANHRFADGDVGSLLLVAGAAVLNSSDQAKDAAELVAFLLEPESQRYFATETFEYPLAKGVEPPEQLPPLGERGGPVPFAALGSDLETTVRMIEESGLRS